MKDKKVFGLFIKEKRIEKNFSQKELADLLYVSESAVSKWERGVTYPDITLITDICRVLDITEHELIDSSHDEEYRKIKKDARKYNNLKRTLLLVLNILYGLALLICFIVNLAVNHALSWFFIVLTAIMTAYSFCPTLTFLFKKNKKIVFLLSTFISLFLLFLTCSIYTNNYWFLIPTVALLLTYFIVFYPIVFTEQKKYLEEKKYNKLSRYFLISYIIGLFCLISLLLIVINAYKPFDLRFAYSIVYISFIIPMVFGLLSLFGKKGLLKYFLSSVGIILLAFTLLSLVISLYENSSGIENIYIINEEYSNININVNQYDINIYLSQTNENKVVCKESEKVKLDIKVSDGVLAVDFVDERKFYNKLFTLIDYEMDLYLSEDFIKTLNIKFSTGDIEIDKGITFENIFLKGTTGDVKIQNCNITSEAIIETSTGEINLNNLKAKELKISVNTGDVKLDKVIVSNNFTMNGSTSDLMLNDFDASNIYITINTGDVTGNILSTKFFIAKSKTGKVIVPETREGGECRISTSTGDIIIKYK